MKLTALDLNLLLTLDALLEESSVARAALRVGRSQPAVSHALRHLRLHFEDQLLVRVGHQMHLTPKAESLRGPLADIIQGIEGLLSPSEFDARNSNRQYRLMMPELASSVLLPALAKLLVDEAPNVRLEMAGWRGLQMMTADFARTLDAVVTWGEHSFPGFHRQKLYTDRDALAYRTGHPSAAAFQDLDGFLSAPHIAVIGPGEASDPVDIWLAKQSLERRILLTLPNFLQALHMVGRSDLVAVAPGRTIKALSSRFGLEQCRTPVDPGEDQQFLFYPARSAQDPASIWLRDAIVRASKMAP